ncbi:HAD-IB family hydrolase [bacterium]|nr:HAD-IB family hydrolase [bacterium]
MRAAIFDVDRTLVDGLAGYFFSDWLWRRGYMPRAGKLRTAFALAGYRMKIRHERVMVEVGVTCLSGMTAVRVRELAEACVDEVIWPRVFCEALDKIREHNDAGDITILASGSALPIVEALAARAGAKSVVATRPRVSENGVCLPVAELPLCYHEGKTALVEALCNANGLSLDGAALYSDNHQDISLFARVATPFAVNPDVRLSLYSKTHGIPVMHWTTTMAGETGSGTAFPLAGMK